ncbi:MAG: glucose-6-phosphate dehydrogenase [Desulfohalobiaceae bacterium]
MAGEAERSDRVVHAEPAEEAENACLKEQVEDPALVVIFGATGDLTSRKLFPALHSLRRNGILPERFGIVGVGRTELTHEAFRERMRSALFGESGGDEIWSDMAERVFYHYGNADEPESFDKLAHLLQDLQERLHTGGNILFYFAVPPSLYIPLTRQLGRAGLSRQERGWRRLVVEKPFGHDLESARTLDRALHESFAEHQIFRIDHYLAKETVQNISMLRFANAIFEPLWDRRYVDYVRITAAESVGVGHRAGYYDRYGVLRDMFQNHMMQLLALCAMEPPSSFRADPVRDEKTKVYRSLRPFPTERLEDHLVLGQYTSGKVDGERVPGYTDESGVAADSLTPTFAAMCVYVDNWRWQGVPFYLTSGKRLAAKRTEIVVQFKQVPFSPFRGVIGEDIGANRLVLSIQPREGVSLDFQAKAPGSQICLRNVTMHYDFGSGFMPGMEAYEKALLDCLLGDQTLFWRQDGVELCWSFLTPVLMECDCPERSDMLYMYRAGNWGPQAANRLLPDWDGET